MCIGSDREGRAGVSDGISYLENVSPSSTLQLLRARAEMGWRRGGREAINGLKVCLARPCASKVLSAVMRAVSNGRHSPAVSSVCVWSRSDCVPIGDDLTL